MRASGEVQVVYRDAHLLVLAKPARMPTTSPTKSACLVNEARRIDPTAPRLHATSRLDAEVTGMVTFARTRHANAVLLAARRQHRYTRIYLALTETRLDPAEGTWSDPIGVNPRDPRLRMVRVDGKPAATVYRERARTSNVGPGVCLLELRPQTGRTHQLRVHSAAHGAPLLGDRAYGGPPHVVLPNGRLVVARRTMLHCATLRLPRIDGEGELQLSLPPPDDFRSIWQELGGDALEYSALEDRALEDRALEDSGATPPTEHKQS